MTVPNWDEPERGRLEDFSSLLTFTSLRGGSLGCTLEGTTKENQGREYASALDPSSRECPA